MFMYIIYLAIAVAILLIGLLFVLNYYVFFWGNYLVTLIMCIFLISVGLNGIRKGINSIRQRKNYKLQSLNRHSQYVVVRNLQDNSILILFLNLQVQCSSKFTQSIL